MIIDLLILNVIGWSVFTGFRFSKRIDTYKVICLIIALIMTNIMHNHVTIFNNDTIVQTISEKNFIIPVSEDPMKDFTLTKAFVDELPVTTEMQNIVLEFYYKDNSTYVAEELIVTSSEVIGRLMEMLLIFLIILVGLNGFGFILKTTKREGKQKETNLARFACIVVNLVYNLLGLFIFIMLTKWINYFIVGTLPDINLQGSAFKPLIYKVIDTLIKYL